MAGSAGILSRGGADMTGQGKHVVVIGARIAGLVTARMLRVNGFDVLSTVGVIRIPHRGRHRTSRTSRWSMSKS